MKFHRFIPSTLFRPSTNWKVFFAKRSAGISTSPAAHTPSTILRCDHCLKKATLEGINGLVLTSHSLSLPLSRNYNVILVNAPGAELVAERSEEMKQTALNTFTLSRSL